VGIAYTILVHFNSNIL